LTVGNNAASQAIYKTAYLSIDGAGWTPITLTSSNPVILNNYFRGQATADLTLTTGDLTGGWNYIAFLVAYLRGNTWVYGCADALCASPAGWNLPRSPSMAKDRPTRNPQ